MSTKSVPAFPQYKRNSGVNIATANGGNLEAPTNTGLVFVAGPDGTEIHEIGAICTTTQTSAQTVQLFTSADMGSTFAALPMTGSLAASAVAGVSVNVAHPNGVPMGPTNALALAGAPGPFTHTLSRSGQSENPLWFRAAVPTGGTANAQTCTLVYNYAGTQLSPAAAAPATGSILDLTAGVTNSAATTIAVGGAAAVTVKRFDGTDLVAGDITKGFRYRFVFNGANWILLPTQRLYAALTQSQKVTVTAWGADF
jgi:hypothetical protein